MASYACMKPSASAALNSVSPKGAHDQIILTDGNGYKNEQIWFGGTLFERTLLWAQRPPAPKSCPITIIIRYFTSVCVIWAPHTRLILIMIESDSWTENNKSVKIQINELIKTKLKKGRWKCLSISVEKQTRYDLNDCICRSKAS
jgi:hypothetical protein